MIVESKHSNTRLIKIAIVGLLASFVLSGLTASLATKFLSAQSDHSNFYKDIFSLTGLWIGLVITAVYCALSTWPQPEGLLPDDVQVNTVDQVDNVHSNGTEGSLPRPSPTHRELQKSAGRFFYFYGYKIRPLKDIPLGIAVGIFAQLCLTPAFTWPLSFFVHNLARKISGPAKAIVHNLSGPQMIILGFFVCVMSPLVEELFFRGLLQHGFADAFADFGRVAKAAGSIIFTAGIFALAHFELLQFLPLLAFGIVLGVLAWFTKRLGPGIIAHISFNTVAYAVVARGHF